MSKRTLVILALVLLLVLAVFVAGWTWDAKPLHQH
jgi:hypothetical protein